MGIERWRESKEHSCIWAGIRGAWVGAATLYARRGSRRGCPKRLNTAQIVGARMHAVVGRPNIACCHMLKNNQQRKFHDTWDPNKGANVDGIGESTTAPGLHSCVLSEKKLKFEQEFRNFRKVIYFAKSSRIFKENGHKKKFINLGKKLTNLKNVHRILRKMDLIKLIVFDKEKYMNLKKVQQIKKIHKVENNSSILIGKVHKFFLKSSQI